MHQKWSYKLAWVDSYGPGHFHIGLGSFRGLGTIGTPICLHCTTNSRSKAWDCVKDSLESYSVAFSTHFKFPKSVILIQISNADLSDSLILLALAETREQSSVGRKIEMRHQ